LRSAFIGVFFEAGVPEKYPEFNLKSPSARRAFALLSLGLSGLVLDAFCYRFVKKTQKSKKHEGFLRILRKDY